MSGTNGLQKPKRKPGRPSKLTPEVMATIIAEVKCGAPNNVACAAAGIGSSTFHRWMERASDPEAPVEYREFREALMRARQEGIAARLAIIQKAARNDWRAAAWLLERDLPDVFSLKYRVEHSAKSTWYYNYSNYTLYGDFEFVAPKPAAVRGRLWMLYR